VRAQFSSVLTLLATIGASMTAAAQAPRPASAAAPPKAIAPAAVAPSTAGPAVAPNAAVPAAAARAPQAAQPAAADNSNATGSAIALRDAPTGRNPVLAAFTPHAGGLTANDVATRAVASSDTIAAKNAELRAAAAAVDSAMYQFYPRLGLKASYTRMSPVAVSLGAGYLVGSGAQGGVFSTTTPTPYGPGVPLPTPPAGAATLVDANNHPLQAVALSFPIPNNYYSLGASLGVPISDYVLRLSNSIDATRKNQEASELNLKAERRKVEADARVAFFNWAMSIGQVAVTEKSLDRVQARLKDVQTSFTLGAVTKADVLRLQSIVATTEAGLEASRAFKQLAEQQLSVIMDGPPQEFALGEDVLADRSPVPLQPLENLVQVGLANRYELKSLDKAADSMRSAETVIRRGQLPRVDAFADYTYANPNQRYLFVYAWRQSWDVGLAATWNINEIFTSNSSGNEMAAKRQALEANRKALAKGIRMEITSAYTDARRYAAELEAAKRAAEAAQAAYDTEVELFKVGKATTTELIDAEGELVNALLRLISAHINIRIAETKIAQATGRDLQTLKN
jgi:outer membrane protein